MNKSALKSFATEARLELLEKIQLQARKLGITPDAIQHASLESSDAIFIDGKPLSDVERKQRNKLITHVNEIGYDRVMEEAAYTWFNRFIALRYMEVNDYLPTKVRVLSSVNPDSTEPDMFKEALNLDLPIDKELVYNLKIENKTDELFKYLIKIHCNDLNRYMSFMFETIEGYMEVLFPEGLLGTDTFVRKMTDVTVIPEKDWANVEIVGWLYQYYISDENDRVIKAKKRYKAEELPFATQLFTPEWIVRYMVQNALGRYWIEAHPEHRDLISDWEYYLENPNSEADFEEKLAPYINKELNVEDIKCFDPAMGSGHILVYMFDVLFEIYSKCGYMEREIPRLIVEKNLYGLDIDDRAYQLASFSVIMKAMKYNKRFLRSIERDGLIMNLASIQETNNLTAEEVAFLAGASSGEKYEIMNVFVNQFKHAKSIGSLIQLDTLELEFFQNRIVEIEQQSDNLFELELKGRILPLYKNLLHQFSIMDKKYDVFITNPPYAGSKYVTSEVSEYLNKNYSDVKSDLFSAFIEYSFKVTKENGHMGFMTPFVWMFISTYEKLRSKIINEKMISSLVQLEYSGFDGATVPICTFTLKNYQCDLSGTYIKLSDFKGAKNQSIKTLEAVQNPTVPYRYQSNEVKFSKIPGKPIAYWLSNVDIFEYEKLGNTFISGGRNKTHDNEKYVRYFWEVTSNNNKWVSYLNGGDFKKYYGNDILVVDWSKDSQNYYASHGGLLNPKFVGKVGLTWNLITSATPGFRIKEKESLYSSGSPTIFNEIFECDFYVLGLLNSKVAQYLLKMINPTLNTTVGDVLSLPLLVSENKKRVTQLVEENTEMAKEDWDSFETSRNFMKHPFLVNHSVKVETAFIQYKEKKEELFHKTKLNEEEINRVFINLYSLQTDLDCNLSEEAITISLPSINKDIKSFISYAIGCTFGRYSLDEEGLVYAGGEFDMDRYKTFLADSDNVLPILDGAYFEDDIVSRFVEFVRVTFSEEKLEENLDFIADAIGRKKTETARETIRRYFLNDFFKDHVQTYKKRPLYWLFTSGKEKAFNCLIYMHRYDNTTLSRIRTDYVHEVQNRMDAEKIDLLNVINGDSTVKEIAAAKKELKLLEKKIDELKTYDELLHHMADQQIEIDLDDGVKHNYELFEGLVAKI
ncbi:BREX-1 system adenine-specific DNA-methyltransferase PglX [Lysinibacillus sp. FSL P2-0066]|uniref:BREX-1 system adenine-specific DNA-methyltransferase PglX n=1 Tax=Lysinibacillus sp. FSL P2-0066 TaxID=2921720 RepID=UPI0030DB4AF5